MLGEILKSKNWQLYSNFKDDTAKRIQLGLIAKPSLLQSMCENISLTEDLLVPGDSMEAYWLGPQDNEKCVRQSCHCHSKCIQDGAETSDPCFGKRIPSWCTPDFNIGIAASSHHHTCPLFWGASTFATARLRFRSCAAFLAGAIKASLTIIRGAGGFSISPRLQCACAVANNSPAFNLIGDLYPGGRAASGMAGTQRKIRFQSILNDLERLFSTGGASPYDVNEDEMTLLHVLDQLMPIGGTLELTAIPQFAVLHFGTYYLLISDHNSMVGYYRPYHQLLETSFLEDVFQFLKRLGELGVPLNWTNDINR